MAIITMTYDLAMACAKDKANAAMRKAGREAWSLEDYNLMVDEFNRLYPLESEAEMERRTR